MKPTSIILVVVGLAVAAVVWLGMRGSPGGGGGTANVADAKLEQTAESASTTAVSHGSVASYPDSSGSPVVGGGEQTDDRRAVSLAEIEALIVRYQHSPKHILPKDVRALDATTERALIQRYQAALSIQQKEPILRVLALGGGDESYILLTNAFLTEYKAHVATDNDRSALISLPTKLGLLANRNDKALHFLLEVVQAESGMKPGLWVDPSLESSDLAGVQIGRCYVGLAFSGRPEVQSLFDDLLLQPRSKQYPRRVSGAICDGAFALSVIKARGFEGHLELLRDHDEVMIELRRFTKTEEGSRWVRWDWEHSMSRQTKPPVNPAPAEK